MIDDPDNQSVGAGLCFGCGGALTIDAIKARYS